MTIIRENPRQTQGIKNDIQTLWIEDGIIIKVYRPEIKNITMDIAKRLVKERIELFKGQTYPMLADTNGVSSIDNDARVYLGSEEANIGISAIAILSYSSISTIIINFFIKFSQTKIPMKMFTSREKALQWLKQFRNIN